MTWHTPLSTIKSRGATTKRPGSLAGLAAARAEHFGQFFTPPELVELAWRVFKPAEERLLAACDRRLSLFDNSVGVGRMFWPANPETHRLIGLDVDGDAIQALSHAAGAAGFTTDFINAGMEQVEGGRADVALINPPFSLTLQNPGMKAFPGITHHGKLGPHTSATSQHYAIAQALDICQVVIAVVPSSFVEQAAAIDHLDTRLAAVFDLPRGVFRSEGTEVRVSLMVWGPVEREPGQSALRCELANLADPVPDLGLELDPFLRAKPPIARGVDTSSPVITLPVTGDRRVRIYRSGRRIGLAYACGLTQAKVANAVLRAPLQPIEGDNIIRFPTGAKFLGQGRLMVENILSATDPMAELRELEQIISAAGGSPQLDPQLLGYIKARMRTDRIRQTPLRRWAFLEGAADLQSLEAGASVEGQVTRTHLADPSVWGSPALKAGAKVLIEAIATEDGKQFSVELDGKSMYARPAEEITKVIAPELEAQKGWTLIHPGRREAFPAAAQWRLRQAKALGVDRICSWDPTFADPGYQLDDVLELLIAPRGVLGWEMGAGKTRAAIALCLMGGRHNLIVVESHLVDDLVDELQSLGIDPALWQVLRSPDQLDALRKINIISYARIRRPIREGAGRRTWASRLRRRLHTVVADEAHLLRNRASQQSQALWKLSPKRRYALSGSPIANYCRDALPLLIWAGGDGTAYQRYGAYEPMVDPVCLKSMEAARRGYDVFRERFVTLEWCVNEFAEDLREGAKREIPRLRNVANFREFVAPHILRRVIREPELARWISIPTPTRHVHVVDWKPRHLAVYLQTAWEFAEWYRRQKESAQATGKALNLVALLARINAVARAANVPSDLSGPAGCFPGLTSKHDKAIKLVRQFHAQGRQTIVYSHNPRTTAELARELKALGIGAEVIHGEITQARRTRSLRNFRRNGIPVLLATLGVAQTGLNLPEASRVIFYGRSWTAKTEDQAGARVLRPQQKDDVEFHYLHLKGAICEYQAQMVEHKRDATAAAIDYGDQVIAEQEFKHLDTILGEFTKDLAERFGVESTRDLIHDLRMAS
jgi:hypothetical protein